MSKYLFALGLIIALLLAGGCSCRQEPAPSTPTPTATVPPPPTAAPPTITPIHVTKAPTPATPTATLTTTPTATATATVVASATPVPPTATPAIQQPPVIKSIIFVYPGDTLWDIACREYASLSLLHEANPLTPCTCWKGIANVNGIIPPQFILPGWELLITEKCNDF